MEHYEILKSVLNEALANQVIQFGVAFTLAAFIHSGRVKREIRSQMQTLTEAIKELGSALRKDLESQSGRIDLLTTRVSTLENQKGTSHGIDEQTDRTREYRQTLDPKR